MEKFTKRINTEKGPLDFTFLSMSANNGAKYLVTVTQSGHIEMFVVLQRRGIWKVEDEQLLPTWIQKLRSEIVTAIEQNHV